MGWGWALIWVWLGGGGGGRLFDAGRLLTFSAFRRDAYSRWALIRGWVLIRINTVVYLLNIWQTTTKRIHITGERNRLKPIWENQSMKRWYRKYLFIDRHQVSVLERYQFYRGSSKGRQKRPGPTLGVKRESTVICKILIATNISIWNVCSLPRFITAERNGNVNTDKISMKIDNRSETTFPFNQSIIS